MPHVKMTCDYCPAPYPTPPREGYQDWEMHPSWIAGIEALGAYKDWVSSVVLPIAFQWIDENRPDVYATIPDDLRDDVGTVIAAAFKLVKELSAYQNGLAKAADYQAALANGDTSSINPAWTSVVRKVRTSTQEAFAEQPTLQVELPE